MSSPKVTGLTEYLSVSQGGKFKLKCKGNQFLVSKGQLISKYPFGVIVWTKKPTKYLTISALEFEKWSNHKIKALYNV